MCIQYNHDCRLFLVCTYFGFGVSKESREADIAALNEVIDIATKLKEKIESIE